MKRLTFTGGKEFCLPWTQKVSGNSCSHSCPGAYWGWAFENFLLFHCLRWTEEPKNCWQCPDPEGTDCWILIR